jgi:hypothetical protein
MKKRIYLAAAALAIVATLGIGSAMAYFTTYVLADGGVELSMGSSITIPKEKMDLHYKIVSIENTGDYDCYVRVKAFVGAENGELVFSDVDGRWTPGADGYYYYSDIVKPGETTGTIKIAVNGLLVKPEAGEAFNVIVVEECTPVRFDENGNAYADWDAVADVSQSIYE